VSRVLVLMVDREPKRWHMNQSVDMLFLSKILPNVMTELETIEEGQREEEIYLAVRGE
jgi:hypothetical protein